jgi:hypothetical protein
VDKAQVQIVQLQSSQRVLDRRDGQRFVMMAAGDLRGDLDVLPRDG